MVNAQTKTLSDSIVRRLSDMIKLKSVPPVFQASLWNDIEKLVNVVDMATVYTFKSRYYTALDNEKDALEYQYKAVELERSSSTLYNLGVALDMFGKHDLSREAYVEALKIIDPLNISLLKMLHDSFENLFDIDNMRKTHNLLLEKRCSLEEASLIPIRDRFFEDDQSFVEFGKLINSIIRKFFKERFILGKRIFYLKREENFSFIPIINVIDEDDLEGILQCNIELAETIVDYEDRNNIDLSNLNVYCEAI